jgi:hypothetical protein
MSDPSDDDLIRAWMAQHHPSVPVTDAALAQTRTASAAAPPATPWHTPTRALVPTLQNGVRSAGPDADADKFAQYMRQNFPGTLHTGN